MRTDDLIGLLATGAGPAPRHVALRAMAPVAAVSLGFATLASVLALGLIPPAMWAGTALWGKLAYALGLSSACGGLAARLSRPAAGLGWTVFGPPLAFAAIVAAGGVGMPAQGGIGYLMGQSALTCPWVILAVSVPGVVGMLRALRRLAPTRLRLTGLVAGLMAGGLGAAGYALSCTEESLGFVAIWYSLGIALAGGLGAALGGRMLRW